MSVTLALVTLLFSWLQIAASLRKLSPLSAAITPTPGFARAQGDTAFVIYAGTSYERQLRCEALVESLRSAGAWTGPIYFLTENVKCYQHERWTQCGLDAEVVLLPPHQTHLGRMFMPRSTSMQMAAASIKSRVWDLLPSTDLQAVVYLDGCDLLITQPVAPMLQSLLPLVLPTSSRQGSAGSRQSTAGEEPGGQPAEAGPTDGEQQQQQPVLVRIQPDTLPSHNATASSQGDQQGSEVWLLARQSSGPLLAALRQQTTQLAPPSPSSWALLQAAAHQLDACCPPGSPSCQSARVLETPPGQWLQALQCAEEQGCHSGAVMAAMPKTCSRTGSRLISKWVASRELCSHQGLDYSLPPRMQPLLSPWMPYPPCAKVELGLSRVLCQWSCTETSYIRTATFRTTITHPRLLP